MATVKIEVTGELTDVLGALTKIDNALSMTSGDIDADDRTTHEDGSVTIHVTADANEAPGGSDQYEFDRHQNPSIYPELFAHLTGALWLFNGLERYSVVQPRAEWLQQLRVFHQKLGEYIDSTAG